MTSFSSYSLWKLQLMYYDNCSISAIEVLPLSYSSINKSLFKPDNNLSVSPNGPVLIFFSSKVTESRGGF